MIQCSVACQTNEHYSLSSWSIQISFDRLSKLFISRTIRNILDTGIVTGFALNEEPCRVQTKCMQTIWTTWYGLCHI